MGVRLLDSGVLRHTSEMPRDTAERVPFVIRTGPATWASGVRQLSVVVGPALTADDLPDHRSPLSRRAGRSPHGRHWHDGIRPMVTIGTQDLEGRLLRWTTS